MTTEQKAKAYLEALERARKQRDDYQKELDKTDKSSQLAGLLRAGISAIELVFPELKESEDEKIYNEIMEFFKMNEKRCIVDNSYTRWIAWLEKQKENPKSADSISSDCVSDAKCENRWHKVGDSLPDSTREVICKDAIGNFFIGRYYKGSDSWEVSMYDDVDKSNEDNPPVVMWCDIPSEKQKEPKNVSASTMIPSCWEEKQKEQKKPTLDNPDLYGAWDKDLLEEIHYWLGHLDGKYIPYTIDDIKLTARHFVEWQKQKEQKPAEWSEDDSIKSGILSKIIFDYAFHKDALDENQDLTDEYAELDNWLESLPERFSLQPKNEWSEEDEDMLNSIINVVCGVGSQPNGLREKQVNFLKSLRPQPKQE